jgi:calcineurin-like phosphoesterase family protein
MSIFFIADMHINEEDIIHYESRPYTTVDSMNYDILLKWNDIIKNNDIVYVVGDVGVDVDKYIKQLNGVKYLIKGNHDVKSNQYYRDIGFEEVYDHPIILDNFWIVSHEPMYINNNMPYANIFGHVHNNPMYKTCSSRSYCVSVERIDYKPISFDKIKKAIQLENQKLKKK